MSERKDKTTTKAHVMQNPRRQAKGQTSSTTCKRTPSDRHIVLPDDCNIANGALKVSPVGFICQTSPPPEHKKTHTHIYIYIIYIYIYIILYTYNSKKHAHENDESQVGTSAVTRCHKNIKLLLSLMSLGHRSFFRCWPLIDFLPVIFFRSGKYLAPSRQTLNREESSKKHLCRQQECRYTWPHVVGRGTVAMVFQFVPRFCARICCTMNCWLSWKCWTGGW